MVLPNPLNCIYDDTINNSKDAQAAENKLQDAPGDVTTRAQLMHYYYNSEVPEAHRKVSINRDRRLQHACWFIQNSSDLRFCGTSPFYFLESDERWESVRQVWQAALTESATIDTRIFQCETVSASKV